MTYKKKKIDKDLEIVGQTIKELREKKGISQEAIAADANIHRTYWCDCENGTRNVGTKNLIKIARILNVHPSVLLKKLP